MRTYRVQFVRSFENIPSGWVGFLPEDMAARMVDGGFAVYYVV